MKAFHAFHNMQKYFCDKITANYTCKYKANGTLLFKVDVTHRSLCQNIGLTGNPVVTVQWRLLSHSELGQAMSTLYDSVPLTLNLCA